MLLGVGLYLDDWCILRVVWWLLFCVLLVGFFRDCMFFVLSMFWGNGSFCLNLYYGLFWLLFCDVF